MSDILFVITSSAQIYEHLCDDDYFIDSTQINTLQLEVDALTFFRDNEYNSSLTKGYSLPGIWINPKAEYNPSHNIHMELGFNALILEGANKYPNYAYHDISKWKGNQYQSGAHILPWFRAQLNTEHTCFVLGDIYGGSNHRLSEPMYNPEQNLTADPEMGFQAIIDYRLWHFDSWINWQSYIFEEDSHQETFTVGFNSQLRLNDPKSEFHYYIPFQTLIQHRGGEQDTTSLGVQTLINSSLGLEGCYKVDNRVINTLNAGIAVYGCFQESGELWPKSSGMAFDIHGSVNMYENFFIKTGWFRSPKYYVNLFGSPLFSTYSIKNDSEIFKGMSTIYIRLDYSKTYYKKYTFGANIDFFCNNSHEMYETNCSFGVYLKVIPSFILKKY